VKLGSEPTIDVELDAGDVSGFRGDVMSEIEAFFCEEVGAFLACLFPAFREPRSASAPVIELIEVREFGVIAKEL
jgi:hypothetical protein